MAESVSMSDEMTSVDAGCTLTLFAERLLTGALEVLAGSDIRRFSLMRAEVRGGMAGPGESSIMMAKGRRDHIQGRDE